MKLLDKKIYKKKGSNHSRKIHKKINNSRGKKNIKKTRRKTGKNDNIKKKTMKIYIGGVDSNMLDSKKKQINLRR